MTKNQLKEYCEGYFNNFILKWEDLKPLVSILEETLNKFNLAIYDFIDKPD